MSRTLISPLAIILAGILFCTLATRAAPGDVTNFSAKPLAEFESPGAMGVFPDGSLLLVNDGSNRGAGYTKLIRLNKDGLRDDSFSLGGPAPYSIKKIIPLADGKALLEVFVSNSARDVFRINADGSRDQTFNLEKTAQEQILSVAPLPDGSWLASVIDKAVPGDERLSRFLPSGARDSTFTQLVIGRGMFDAFMPVDGGKTIVFGHFRAVNGFPSPAGFRVNADGSVDAGFRLRDATGADVNSLMIDSLAIDSDRKILVCGRFKRVGQTTRANIARFNQDGTLDSTFSLAPINDLVHQIVPQANGSIVIAGFFRQVGQEIRDRIARLNADGSLDGGFLLSKSNSNVQSISPGPGNRLYASISPGVWRSGDAGGYVGLLDTGASLAGQPVHDTQPSARVVMTGQSVGFEVKTRSAMVAEHQWQVSGVNLPGATNASLTVSNVSFTNMGSYVLITRNGLGAVTSAPAHLVVNTRPLTPGAADESFNFNVSQKYGENVNVMVVYPFEDKILVGGNFVVKETGCGGVARLNQDGSIDASFSPGTGVGFGAVLDLTVDPVRGIYVGGNFGGFSRQPRPAVARLKLSGEFDASFDPKFAGSATCAALVLLGDGKLLVGGHRLGSDTNSLVVRLKPDGSEDTTFKANLDWPNGRVTAMGIQRDGKLMAGGYVVENKQRIGKLARLLPDGSEDPSYAPLSDGEFSIRKLMIEPDDTALILLDRPVQLPSGKRLITAHAIRISPAGAIAPLQESRMGRDFAVRARPRGGLLFGGFAVRRFDATGVEETNFVSRVNGLVSDLCELENGDILVAGSFNHIGGLPRSSVARLHGTEIVLAPQLFGPYLASGGFELSIPTLAGKRYVFEYRDAFGSDSWKPLLALDGTGEWRGIHDPATATAQRFYRVRVE